MDSQVREGWAEWAIGMAVILLRIYARVRVVGWRWQGDDCLVLLSGACYTGVFVTTLVQRPRGSNVGLTDQQREALTPAQIKPMEEGSKAILAALYIYATGLWSMKGQVLFLFHRFTLGLWQQKLVKWTSYACGIFYIVIILVTSCRCIPIKKTWQVYPDPGEFCTTSKIYYIVTELSNELTDLTLFLIPLPIILKVQIPWHRKILIAAVLCSGLFVFIVSIIRLVITLGDISRMSTLAIWAIREMFVAVLYVNAPCIKPLFSSSRWVKTTGNSYENRYNQHDRSEHIELRGGTKDIYPITQVSPHGSSDEIVPSGTTSVSHKPYSSSGPNMEIVQTTEIEVKSWDPVNKVEHEKS